MRALILDGSQESDPMAGRVQAAVMSALRARRWDMEHVVLRDQKIGNCAGDFFCWIRTPGICNVNDDNRRIAQSAVERSGGVPDARDVRRVLIRAQAHAGSPDPDYLAVLHHD